MDQSTFVEGFHDPEAVKKMTYHPLGNTGEAFAWLKHTRWIRVTEITIYISIQAKGV